LKILEKDGSFKKKEIVDLRTSYRLAELTQGDFSVVKAIKEEFGIRQPEKIRTLAKRSEGEWVNLVKEKSAGGKISLPLKMGKLPGKWKVPEAKAYGKMLERRFREAFPTTAFTGGLERALRNGGARGLRHAEALGKFLDVHQDFELLNTPVDDFLKSSIHPDFEPLAKDEDFRLELKAVQRVFKLVPTFEATDALLADGIHSAQKVYRMGKSEFVRRYADGPGFTKDAAELAWNRAAETHAAVLSIVGELKALDPDSLPKALKSGDHSKAALYFINGLNHCPGNMELATNLADAALNSSDTSLAVDMPDMKIISHTASSSRCAASDSLIMPLWTALSVIALRSSGCPAASNCSRIYSRLGIGLS